MGRINLKLVSVFYGVMLAMALLWMMFRGDPQLFVHPGWRFPVTPEHVGKGLALGAASAVLVVVVTRLLSVYFEWARRLEIEMAKLLGPLSYLDVLVISIFSAVGEELFFRGAMQPTLGLTATTIFFGFLHIGPSRTFIPWTLSAFIIGGVFGWYYEINGTLAAPISAHFLINLVNLNQIRLHRAKTGMDGTENH